jgi:hypothetical protein
MPIQFAVHTAQGYFTSKYSGKITDQEVMDSWEKFLNGPDWRPGLNELADLSEADISEITSEVIKELADYTREFYKGRGLDYVKAAIYAPKQVLYGLSRMYVSWTGETPEEIGLFEDIEEAKAWLKSP